MFRTLAVASAFVAAAALSTQPFAAQSAASSKPAMHQAPAQQVDSTKAGATTLARHAAWTKDQVKAAQQGLAKAGLYKGEATGVWNQDTKKALRAYQKENKMPVTGRLSDSVLVKLKSA